MVALFRRYDTITIERIEQLRENSAFAKEELIQKLIQETICERMS